jgi:lysophospholipase L1-like esterase
MKKKIFAVGIAVILLSLSLVVVYSEMSKGSDKTVNLTRVACVGDSITELSGYPEDLQTLLGDKSNVTNFGASGSTVVFTSVKPYIFQEEYYRAWAFQPTTIIIMLGTNDARTDVYPDINRFVSDYERIISQFQALKSNPQIFLVNPPPVFDNDLNITISDLLQGVIPAIDQVANDTGLPLIDIYTPLLNHPEYFVDGVHLNTAGGQYIANIIAEKITTPLET